MVKLKNRYLFLSVSGGGDGPKGYDKIIIIICSPLTVLLLKKTSVGSVQIYFIIFIMKYGDKLRMDLTIIIKCRDKTGFMSHLSLY